MIKNKFLASIAVFGLVAGAVLGTTAPVFADDLADNDTTALPAVAVDVPEEPAIVEEQVAPEVVVDVAPQLAIQASQPAPLNPVVLEGEVGDLQPWSEDTNHPEYWEDLYDLPEGSCVKYDADENGNSSGDEGSSSGKTVTLNAGSWTLLVVKGGNVSNNVIVDPTPGVAYASPLNSGGQQSNVSHWIVCYGDEPGLAIASATPVAGGCDVAGSVTFFTENATWDDDSDTTDGSRDATADDGYTFDGGSTTATVTYTIPGVDPSLCDLATATLVFTPASCSANQTPNIAGSSISNATWGSDTDASPLGYTIVATANSGALFTDGNPGGLTKTFSGTLDQQLSSEDPKCGEGEPDLATASLEFTPTSCLAPQQPNIGGSSISKATWGSDTDASELGFTIVATANSGALFTDGDLGGLTKTFTGTLDPIIPDGDPRCPGVLGLVLPTVLFTQATCSATGSYTLGVAEGYDPTHVSFTVNGVSGIPVGTYQVLSAKDVTVTAQAVAPNGLELEWVDPPTFSFLTASGCGQLVTLALTGTSSGYLGWALGGSALLLGAALMLIRRRNEAMSK